MSRKSDAKPSEETYAREQEKPTPSVYTNHQSESCPFILHTHESCGLSKLIFSVTFPQ